MEQYKVKKGDTLWKLARKNGTTVEVLAELNNLRGRKLHMLREDQMLFLPGEAHKVPDCKLIVRFRGLASKEFTPKRAQVEHDGKRHTLELNPNGLLLLEIDDHSLGLKILIEDLSKKMIRVFDNDTLPLGKYVLNIDSRALKTDGALQSKKGTSTAASTDVKASTTHNAQVSGGNTAVEQARVETGKPVQVIATIYTNENLRLHPKNEKYRDFLLASAKKYDTTPQALAALIQAEAATLQSGEWNEKTNSDKPKRKAKGLCQFMEDGWTAVHQDPNSLLYQDCKKMDKSQWMAKRFEAKYAIDGTAAYAKMNLRSFKENSKYDVDALAAEDKAKLAYLLHHEGDFGTRRLLGLAGNRTSKEWAAALGVQLGTNSEDAKAREQAEARRDSYLQQYGGNGHLAYKGWLFSIVDSKINVNHFVVEDANAFTKKPRSIAEITESLTKTPQVTKPLPKSKAPPPAPAPAQKATTAPKTAPTPTPTQAPSTTPQQTQTPDQEGWHDPLAVCTLRTENIASKLGSTFGMTRNGGTKAHQGLDFVAAPGTPIYAVADGKVVPVLDPTTKGYGDTAVLVVDINDLPEKQAQLVKNSGKTQGTIGFAYAHLSELPHEAKFVQAGDIIGKTGCTGNANTMTTIKKGAHLHFEIRVNPYHAPKGLANRIDPLPFINNCTNK